MMGATEPEQTIVELAEFLCGRQERIIDEWMTMVRLDPRIPASDTITTEQLRNHLPMMLDDLIETLRSEADVIADVNAIKHGNHRWEQGYRLDELLRELARVRLVLLDQILEFEQQQPEFRDSVKQTALRRVYFFFDHMVTRSAEQFVNDLQAELRQRNEHLQAVDDSRLRLLRASSHDLRNAANAAQLSIDALGHEDDPAARRELAGMASRNMHHMNDLVRELLTFATLFDAANSARLVPIRVDDFFDELVANFSPQATSRGLIFKAQRDEAVNLVMSDPTKLRQISHNLLSNAVKYTTRGFVAFAVRSVGAARWSICVEDSGPGFSPEERDRLYREYHRAPDTAHVEGTGLGLWIVSRLVELLKGEIRLDSELGRGSRFEVILPRNSN